MMVDTVRAQLQLAVGGVATLGEELPALGGQRLFEATLTAGARRVLVTLYPAAPEGPIPGALATKVARFTDLAHPAIVLPLRTGELDGRAWVIDAADGLVTARERMAARGALPVRDAVRAVRDVARALVAMHRRSLTHGALGLDTVLLAPEGTLITGLTLSTGGHEGDDLDAFGLLARTLFYGDRAEGNTLRRRLPPEITALLDLMADDGSAREPQSAEAVLRVLDTFPVEQSSALGEMVDSAGRGARSRPMQTTLGLLAIGGMIVLVLYWLLSHR
jgi:hypothetical protein